MENEREIMIKIWQKMIYEFNILCWQLTEEFLINMNSRYSLSGFSLFLSKSLIFFSDLVKLFHVLVVLWASLESNEQLGLLGISSVSLDSDCSSLDFLECSVVVSYICLNLKMALTSRDFLQR